MKQIVIAALLAGTLANIGAILAREGGDWSDTDPVEHDWVVRQRFPEADWISCCGAADFYYADSFAVDADGNTVAIITDDRPDEPRGRPHIPVGTRFIVPLSAMKDSRPDPNPSGHGGIFIGEADDDDNSAPHKVVYCYIPPTGV